MLTKPYIAERVTEVDSDYLWGGNQMTGRFIVYDVCPTISICAYTEFFEVSSMTTPQQWAEYDAVIGLAKRNKPFGPGGAGYNSIPYVSADTIWTEGFVP